MSKTLYDKIWEDHLVHQQKDGTSLLFVDRPVSYTHLTLPTITEGKRERIQYFEGVCIAKKNRDINSSFTVRKISFGEGVERTFALFSPIVDTIKVIRSGKVRRAKLYYLRDRTGKSAKIAEKIKKKIGIDIETKPEQVTEENVVKQVAKDDKIEITEDKKSESLKKDEELKEDSSKKAK